MFYEITDTNTTMHDTLGNDLGMHPVFVIEGDSPEAALAEWHTQHGRDTEGVVVKEVG